MGGFVYVASAHRALLRQEGMDDMDRLWALEKNWVEPMNERRDGWSGVVRLNIGDMPVFVKRQQGQSRRSLRHPRGRPTYYYEHVFFRKLNAYGDVVPELVLYAERFRDGERQTVLITRALEGFQPLSKLVDTFDPDSVRQVLENIGRMGAGLHGHFIQHLGFHPEHIFVNPETLEVRLLDFERARVRPSRNRCARRDLQQLSRRAAWMNREYMEAVLASYPRWLAASTRRKILDVASKESDS